MNHEQHENTKTEPRLEGIMLNKKLLDQILALSLEDRRELVNLLESLDDDLAPQLNPKEQKELLRRAEEAKKHPERLLTWEQVKQNLAEQRAKRSP
jgi:putative addiction module component (TIGR02574 family)